MTQNKVKAIRLLTSQEVNGKAPVTKLISAPAYPKTFISSKRGDSAFTLEDSTIGSEYHYSASDAGSSTASQSEGLMTTTYMVSCHDADDQEDLTENEEKVNLEETKVTKEEGSETHALEEASTEKKKAKRKERGEPLTKGPQPNFEVRQKFCEEVKEAPMVLRYVPATKRKEEQSPFGLMMETKDKCKKPIQEEDIAILKSGFTLPLPRLSISLPRKEGTSHARRSAFDRLGSTSSSTDTPRPKEGRSGLQKRNGTEVYSLIPSLMTHELIVEISTRNSLKVKRQTIVHTRELKRQVDNGEEDYETLVLPSCHVTVETDSESNASDDEPNEAPRQ
nr:hypothetical protein CFP56_18217 [Quercus suber]